MHLKSVYQLLCLDFIVGPSIMKSVSSNVSFLVYVFLFLAIKESLARDADIPHNEVTNWAIRFGVQMWEIGKQTTRLKDIHERYKQEATIRRVDGLELLRQMADDVDKMVESRTLAVRDSAGHFHPMEWCINQRIMDVAEQASMSHREDSGIVANYYNAKRLNEWYDGDQVELKEGYKELKLTPNPRFFGTSVNLSLSSVHVPTNVFDGAPDVQNSLFWSERLNPIFVHNYETDPTLSWQFFGSSTGYMRQYPAVKWLQDEYEADLFDCRVRPWYIRAAASAKDMIILLDTSGSMTGVRKEIARHVVINLLETLSDNDFVNVMKFGEVPEAVVPCFQDKLVQANLENIRELRLALDETETVNIANFSAALTQGFEILAKYNRTNQGTQCNQAIMLVTDGAPQNYHEIFEKYNLPHKPVRLFTYLIGREITDTKATEDISCNNKDPLLSPDSIKSGELWSDIASFVSYFTHVTTLAEVREQVLKYIPVLARPMVLYQNHHPVVWSHVYADLTDPKLSDWLWELRERRRQRDRTTNFRQLHKIQAENGSYYVYFDPTQVERFLQYGQWQLTQRQLDVIEASKRKVNTALKKKKKLAEKKRFGRSMESIGEPSALPLTRLSTLKLLLQRLEGKTANSNPRYRLMTTLATPVYDRRNFSNITEYILVNDAVWVERIKTVRTANILGVAGTDVPVKDFQKLIPAYKLGVNGYSFITTNNGYVLFHPDYRPIYQDILKPNFNAVDMSEVELVDTDDEPRNNDTVLMQMRREMIEKRDGEMNMRVRVHIDSMRRASIRQNRYFYKGIKETPFSLAIVQPEGYGQYRVEGQKEIKHYRLGNVSELFKKKNWKVHPDWIYCQYMYDTPDHALLTPEAEVFHFMERSQRPAWKWRSRYGAQSSKDSSKGGIYSKRQNKDDYFCDKDLFQSLVFDAIATQPFDEKGLIKYSKSDGLGILKMFGVSIIFVATRSGLLKWHDEVTLAEREDGVYHPYGEGYENRNPYRKHHGKSRHTRSQRFKARRGSPFLRPVKRRQRNSRHFSESNNGAIDEIWYKRAVEQNSVEPDSFVYSLPFDAGMKNDSLVTASHASFVDKEGHKAPAAVVGLQFKHSLFVETFFNITHTCMAGMKCNSTCASEELECYVLDNNGFIIISEKRENSGKFFGEVDGTIMDSLVHYEIYQKIRIYDYQSVCFDKTEKKSSASLLLTPLKTIKLAASWAVGRLSWLVLQTQLSQFLSESWVGAISQLAEEVREEVDDFVEATDPNQDFPPDPKYSDPPVIEVGNPNIEAARINKTRVRPCDREVDLYNLQQEKLYDSEKQQNKPLKGRLASCSQSTFGNQCGRSFTAHRIPHSNLILVVVDTLCPCDSRKMSIEPTEVYYNETERCDRLSQPLYRQRPTECISYHPEEEEIKMCGTCSKSNFSLFGLLLPLYVILRSILSS